MWNYQRLLTKKGNSLSGPFSPFEFAKGICLDLKIPFSGLCRIWFKDEMEFMHQYNEGSKSNPCITGHDTLVVLSEFSNTNQLLMLVDCGINCVPAFQYFKDQNEVSRMKVYDKQNYLMSLSNEQALEILSTIDSKNLAKPKLIN